jgi:ABC-2 type transport system ATP-binding protein
MKTAIEVQDLTKYYGDYLAVDHISFEVHQGEIFGFLGPNGAGKSTTQRMLTTLLEPTSGKILINGHDLAHDAYPAKQVMGMVPEESNIYTELTAWDNLIFTERLYRVSSGQRAARAQELLEAFGLWEKRAVKAENFSKGMRRRLSIAMAIVHQPSLLFLDEPVPGLDAQSARAIRSMIRQLNSAGTTVFLTTHDIEEANQLCDRVAIIHQGKIVAIDTPEHLKATMQRVQSVELALEPDHQEAKEQMRAFRGVTQVVKTGDKWRLYTDDPSLLIPQIVHFTEAQGIRIVHLTTLGPSLEDVFLEITGQEIGTLPHENGEQNKRRLKMGGRS